MTESKRPARPGRTGRPVHSVLPDDDPALEELARLAAPPARSLTLATAPGPAGPATGGPGADQPATAPLTLERQPAASPAAPPTLTSTALVSPPPAPAPVPAVPAAAAP